MLKRRIQAITQALPVRLSPVVSERLRHHFTRFTPGLWVWTIIASLLILILALLLGHVFFTGDNLSGQAIQSGQRVIIDVATGEVEGNARHSKVEAPKPATVAAAAVEAPIISREGLAPAPLEALSERTDKGLLPIIGKDGLLPWKYYARPLRTDPKRPLVAIVVTALGLSKPLTEDALKLPHEFTLSFSPYAGDARKWATLAREQGFETLVDLPMQSLDYAKAGIDPGPHGLMEDAGVEENSNRLQWVLSRFSGFVGVLAPENESMTGNLAALRPVLTELAGHGVLFFYVKTPGNTAFSDMGKTHQLSALGIDEVIDDDIAPGPIDKKLQDLTALAKTQGYAIGFAHAYPPTLDAFSRWVGTLATQGVDLAPVSAIAMKASP